MSKWLRSLINFQDPDEEDQISEEDREEFIKLIEKMQDELNKNSSAPSYDETSSQPNSMCKCKKLINGCGCGGGRKEINRSKK